MLKNCSNINFLLEIESTTNELSIDSCKTKTYIYIFYYYLLIVVKQCLTILSCNRYLYADKNSRYR